MSRSKRDEENQENLMVLRLPEKYAKIVRQAVNKGNLRERLQIDIKDDCRNAYVKIEEEILPGKVYDLPCIVECQKTVDNKIFYKSGDICQMLMVGEGPLDPQEVRVSQMRRKEKTDSRKFVYPHGITLPMKNVRKKRFRKTAPKKIIDDPEVEKEVRRLLRADISAISVETRIIYDEPRASLDTLTSKEPSSLDALTPKEPSSLDTLTPKEPSSSIDSTFLSVLESNTVSSAPNLGAGCDLSKMLDDTLADTKPPTQDSDKGFSKELLEMFEDLSSEGSSDEEGKEVPSPSVQSFGPKTIPLSVSQDAKLELETLDRKINSLELEVGRTQNTFLKNRLLADLNNLKEQRQKKQHE